MEPEPSIAIIGSGPAGLSAALWLHNLGLKAVIYDRSETLGGTLAAVERPNPSVLGLPGLSSKALCRRFVDHIRLTNVEFRYPVNITEPTEQGLSGS